MGVGFGQRNGAADVPCSANGNGEDGAGGSGVPIIFFRGAGSGALCTLITGCAVASGSDDNDLNFLAAADRGGGEFLDLDCVSFKLLCHFLPILKYNLVWQIVAEK